MPMIEKALEMKMYSTIKAKMAQLFPRPQGADANFEANQDKWAQLIASVAVDIIAEVRNAQVSVVPGIITAGSPTTQTSVSIGNGTVT